MNIDTHRDEILQIGFENISKAIFIFIKYCRMNNFLHPDFRVGLHKVLDFTGHAALKSLHFWRQYHILFMWT